MYRYIIDIDGEQFFAYTVTRESHRYGKCTHLCISVHIYIYIDGWAAILFTLLHVNGIDRND